MNSVPVSDVHHILEWYDHAPNATMVVGGGYALTRTP
jgi:hypothetical protein